MRSSKNFTPLFFTKEKILFTLTLSLVLLYNFFSAAQRSSEGISMTTSPGKVQLNKTIYSSLLAALHLKVASTTRAYASHCTWRQQRQTLLVDGALSGARRTGPRTTSCFWTRLAVDLTIHAGDSPPGDTDLWHWPPCYWIVLIKFKIKEPCLHPFTTWW